MKLNLLTYAMCVMFLLSCSGKKNKFVGDWKVVSENGRSQQSEATITIRKENGQFVLTSSLFPDNPSVMTYLEKEEILTGNIEGGVVSIKYIDSTENLQLKPNQGSWRSIEFSKAK